MLTAGMGDQISFPMQTLRSSHSFSLFTGAVSPQDLSSQLSLPQTAGGEATVSLKVFTLLLPQLCRPAD